LLIVRPVLELALGPVLAVEQSTGTWLPVPGETAEVREKHAPRVIGVYETPDYEWEIRADVEERSYVIQVAFPTINIESQIPMLLTAIVGNISMVGKLKLLDVRLPRSFVEAFGGPKFGIPGVRELLGVKDRPLLNNMIKPCTGYRCGVGVELFREAALGGTDIIKDDELLANMSFNTVRERVEAYMEVEKQVCEETGERTLYTVNVSDEIPQVFENAKRAVELGVNALMVNYLAVGFPVLRALAEDPEIDVPILGHMDIAGALYASPHHGIRSHIVMGKLPRLAGADIAVFPLPYGKLRILPANFKYVARNLAARIYDLKPTFPMPGGGITPAMVPDLIADLGSDIVIGAGGGIHGNPGGPTPGARAFRQAIDATMKGIPLDKAAAEYEELRTALDEWVDPLAGVWR